AGQHGEILRRPALGPPTRSHTQRHPGPWAVTQKLRSPAAFRLRNGHVKDLRTSARAQGLSHEPATVHRMDGVEIRHRYDVGVKPACPFASRTQADLPGRAAAGGNQAAAKQTLQVDDEIKLLLAETANEL